MIKNSTSTRGKSQRKLWLLRSWYAKRAGHTWRPGQLLAIKTRGAERLAPHSTGARPKSQKNLTRTCGQRRVDVLCQEQSEHRSDPIRRGNTRATEAGKKRGLPASSTHAFGVRLFPQGCEGFLVGWEAVDKGHDVSISHSRRVERPFHGQKRLRPGTARQHATRKK